MCLRMNIYITIITYMSIFKRRQIMKTKIGYKLFEMDKDGNLYPLFIDKNPE